MKGRELNWWADSWVGVVDGWLDRWLDQQGVGRWRRRWRDEQGVHRWQWGPTRAVGPPLPSLSPHFPSLCQVGWAHLFFKRPLKSSSPVSSDFPLSLWPLRADVSSTELLCPQTHPGSQTPCIARASLLPHSPSQGRYLLSQGPGSLTNA